jgi:hypothetical protein
MLVELFRPAWHWLSRYPLLPILTVLLLLIAWGKRLQSFDAFFLIWHEQRRPGIAAGATLATASGFFWYLTYLIDKARAQRPNGPPAGQWWAYLVWWWLTLAAFALPAALPGEWTAGEAWPNFNDPNDFSSGRFYFPEGVGIAAVVLSAVALVSAALKRPGLMRWFGIVAIAATVLAYVGLAIWHSRSETAFCPVYGSAVNFLLLLGFIASVYGGVLWAAARWNWVDILVYPATLLLVVAWFPGVNESEHRLPYLTYEGKDGARHDYYERSASLFLVEPEADKDWKTQRYAAEMTLRAGKTAGPEAKPVRQIDSKTMLKNWKKHIGREGGFFPGETRPAVVLTVSGGASTSALYSACLLFDLEDAYPGFGEQIVLITGASGGMVGAAYYASHCQPGGIIDRLRRLHVKHDRSSGEAYRKQADDLRDEFLHGLRQDFLSRVVQKWIAKDLPFNFVQRHTDNDRGRALEIAWNKHLKGAADPASRQWDPNRATFDVPLSSRAYFEEQALAPALVFAPMMVEDGRQLLISNLNLDQLIEAEANPQPHPALTAVEFFKLFRGADQFRLGTAVRMQASFPFVSPAATLPTNPIRRTVDAGYYDNYGVNVALKWIAENEATLREVTGNQGVRLLTMYTYGYESNMDLWTRTDEDDDYQALLRQRDEIVRTGRRVPDDFDRVGRGGFKSATTPFAGLFSSWKANMIYRAEDRIGYVEHWLNRNDPKNKPFFVRKRLPGPNDPPMNWFLRDKIRYRIEIVYGYALRSMAYLKSPDTSPAERLKILERLKEYWKEAYPVLEEMPHLSAEDVASPQSPALRKIYQSRPIFNAATDMLAEMMPPPRGANAVPPPTGQVPSKSALKK